MPIINRPDGDLVRDVPPYRRIMPFLFLKKNESNVYFEMTMDLTRTLPFIEAFNSGRKRKATLFHYILWCIVRTADEWPQFNRFIAGKRLYQRRGIWISFPVIRNFEESSPVSVIKRRFDPNISFADLVDLLRGEIARGKSEESSRVDRQLSFFLTLPRSILSMVVRAFRLLDYLGLLPAGFIEKDPLYATAFVANLGSLGLDAVYHHLYEYGNIPIFMTVGRVKPELYRGDDGQARFRESVTMRCTCDERVADGFVGVRALNRLKSLIEDPALMERGLPAPSWPQA